ncbi:MAG: toll/interleukin-1 receptor domain-containing protein [Smithella sp.]
MWHIHPTEKWIDEVIRLMNDNQLKPEDSKFMIAFFSSMDNEFVDYFKDNKKRISSFSGRNFHIFTPLIYDDNVISDEAWRYMRSEFKALGIPLKTDPTFVFFNLDKWRHDDYEPYFFAGFACSSFKDFPNKLKNAIECSIEEKETRSLARKLSEIFLSENIIPHDQVDYQFKQTITRNIPKSTLFISHSSADKPFARKLIAELSKDNSLKFWIDEKELSAGDDIQKSITSSLHESDYLLIVISEKSTKSNWVNFEISQFMSIAGGKNIIPLVIGKGHSFPEPIDNLIRRLKYLDFSDEIKWQENIRELKQLFARQDDNS